MFGVVLDSWRIVIYPAATLQCGMVNCLTVIFGILYLRLHRYSFFCRELDRVMPEPAVLDYDVQALLF